MSKKYTHPNTLLTHAGCIAASVKYGVQSRLVVCLSVCPRSML